MESPSNEGKNAKLIVNDDASEIPTNILDDIQVHRRSIWWSLLFLNGSCLWAYYTCLSAQSYYANRFATTSFNFAYLTTPVSTWPMFVGHFIQVFFGLDKKLGMWKRMVIGYTIYIGCALAIILQDACDATPQTGAVIVLIAFGLVGFTNSLTEAALYSLSALFPDSAFTNAIQLGNGTSGFINITLNTLIQLCVGGIYPSFDDTTQIQKISFYIFFSAFIVVCFLAVFLFYKLLRIPAVKYLYDRNNQETARRVANNETLPQIWSRLGRIFLVVLLPTACQFIIFLCSLTAFPGIGISTGFQLAGPAAWGSWYINGVLLSYNYGDFAGRLIAPYLYRFFSLVSCFIWSILRWALFIFLLLSLPGGGRNSLFSMESAHDFNIFWTLFVNFLLGITTGILSTITFGLGPRLVPQEDRESAGAIMCLGLFLVPYCVNNTDLYIVLPFTMAFTAFILILPFEAGTKKFALVNNLFSALTLVSPNEFNDPSKLKNATSRLYYSSNLVNNLFLFMCLGLIGVLLAFIFVWLPAPIFAVQNLQAETKTAVDAIQDLLHIMVDTYCFKNKDVEHMHFLKLKLKRKCDVAVAKKDAMNTLLNEAWWEQPFGVAKLFKFQKTVTKPYVELYGSLVDCLRAMNQVLQLEHYESLHVAFMKDLQQQVYTVQIQAIALLQEISHEVHQGNKKLALTRVAALESQMEHLLKKFQVVRQNVYREVQPTPTDVEGILPLNLFLFSLQSFCTTLIEFESKVNQEIHATGPRMSKFIKQSLYSFFDRNKYTQANLKTAFKVWLCLLIASLLSVYVFGYSATTATTIAYVMGNQKGGSFSVTMNRAAGVVAGVIIPSVVLYFSCAYGSNHILLYLGRDIFLFVWITMSMYIKWKGGLDSYAGFVSAFIVVGTLLPDDVCPKPGSMSSYSNLVQMSMGVLLIVGIEFTFWPESAFNLLRGNVQTCLRLMQHSFTALFEQNLKAEGDMDQDVLDSIQQIVESDVPALLAEQKLLLKEAWFEPRLWRQPFSQSKYTTIIDTCQRLLNNTLILYKLVVWFQHRKHYLTIDSETDSSSNWAFSTEELGNAIHDTFDTLHDLFGPSFQFADAEQTALFVQMKEAFQAADKDGSGELDAADVRAMLQRVFEHSGTMPMDAIEEYTQDFLEIVDKDKSGKVSFEEFVCALENGLLLEVEVVHAHTPRLRPFESIQEAAVDLNPLISPNSAQLDALEAALPMSRTHDILDVETFSLLQAAATMRRTYAEGCIQARRFENMEMEELLLLNSLISGVSGIARNLAFLEETTVQYEHHSHVFEDGICVDVLANHSYMHQSAARYGGWTPSSDFIMLMIYMQAFLADPDYALPTIESIQALKAMDVRYKCLVCSHDNAAQEYDIVQNEVKVSTLTPHQERVRREMLCPIMQENLIDHADHLCLGYPLEVRTNYNKVFTTLYPEFMSRAAYEEAIEANKHGVPMRTPTGQAYYDWIALYIHPQHYNKYKALFPSTNVHKHIEMILRAMNTQVVGVIKGNEHESEAAIIAYANLLRLVKFYLAEYPNEQTKLDEQVAQFMQDPSKRHKSVVPDLGEFFIKICLTSSPNLNFTHKDTKDAVFREHFTRQIRWIRQVDPECVNFAKEVPNRLGRLFAASETSNRMMTFALEMFKTFSRGDFCELMDGHLGLPPLAVLQGFQGRIKLIKTKLTNYKILMEAWEYTGSINTPDDMLKAMNTAVGLSKASGYDANNNSKKQRQRHKILLNIYMSNRNEGCTTDATDNAAAGHLDTAEYLITHRSKGAFSIEQQDENLKTSQLNDSGSAFYAISSAFNATISPLQAERRAIKHQLFNS
ncbi:transmembrane protein [Thraustotheca clavata]|uniref:Transmembrane protein n=1 Tax=Thraustotheca clavata TaxID=74557 RepID=A0A1V9Z4X4_9STRA|nr:transmembrane protein [Thraustotheca clavata]